MSRVLAVVAALVLCLASAAQAQEPRAVARIDADVTEVFDARRGGHMTLGLSQGVPWRLFLLDDPRRLVVDFREVDWTGFDPAPLKSSEMVDEVRFGHFRPGWSRLVLSLADAFIIDEAGMSVDATTGKAQIDIGLASSDATTFAAQSGAPFDPRWDLPVPADVPPARQPQPDWAPVVIVIDPGHGGIDPGAEEGAVIEKDMMLRFARELRDMLRRTGRFEVVMTRDEDVFVSLERRISIAHEAGAHIFLSLHADVLRQGHASGATVYTLSQDASDKASAFLAERHDRGDILAGVDLTGADDQVTDILLDLARLENQPRSDRLAADLVEGMKNSAGALNRKPIRSAGFSVLKAADIPSVLVELGFMSSSKDLENLQDPNWRALMAAGIRDGLLTWIVDDKGTRALMRK